MFKIKKSKIASKFWYIYRSGNVFLFLSVFLLFFLNFHCLPSASLVESTQNEAPFSSLRPSVQPCAWTCCAWCFYPVPISCVLFASPSVCKWGGARVLNVSWTHGRQGQSFGYVHIHGRSMAFHHTISAGLKHIPATKTRQERQEISKFKRKQMTKEQNRTYRSVWCTGSHFVSCCVPADLEDSSSPSVTVN